MAEEARPPTQETVELVYLPTDVDVADALRVRMRRTPGGRRLRLLLLTLGIAGIGLLVLSIVRPATDDPVSSSAGALFLVVFSFGLLVLYPALTARQVHRMVASQGEFRAVVGEHGVRWTSRDTEVRSGWEMFPRYAETAELFVLFSGDKNGVGVGTLPKRGLAGAGEADRLRAILDRHITRL
ncbi:YcxB family protein [Streptomyces sp. NPDC090127]|uniref:YcxB family protein n=1 Tax=Streptomyces sp. NPDC090127 TaxID=3365953 RepID=UPI0038013669